ncbi:hypothetical protein NXS15_00570 [Mycoplasma sp. CSL7475-4]|uniref:hypothetical protein n=1 Tax=Mycoplasma sp. CSL7475-4 TaxID=2973942 RepID=UPI00216ACAF3|nr:hypothetical protein [Mycoplasma sp. CSL7475-4]MCS4536626.1 hypothetical protein [Mycoplasma sp. CSL7475-4]
MKKLYSITFSNKDGDKEKTINFGNVNIILGEKGSGKSTFLRMIAETILRTKIFKKEDFVEKSFGLKIKEANIDNETKTWNSFLSMNSTPTGYEKALKALKEKFEVYITQNDDRKKGLDDIYSDDIKSTKKNGYSTELLNKIKKAGFELEFVKNVRMLNNSIRDWNSFFGQSNNLNLNVIYKDITDNNDGSLLWKTTDARIDVKKLELKDAISSLRSTVSKLSDPKLLSTSIGENNSFLSSLFEKDNEELQQINEEIYKSIQRKINIYQNAIEKIEKLNQTFIKFNDAYTQASNSIRETMEENEKNQSDYDRLTRFFKDMPSYLKNIKKSFDLVNGHKNEEVVDFAIEPVINKEYSSITYSIPPFALNESEKGKIIKIISTSTSNTVPKNLISLIKKPEDFSADTSQNAMEKVFEEWVKTHHKVNVDNQIYETLSNGQKTLFGIKNTINNSNPYKETSNFLLLDQIEDDLDSWTIIEEIIPLLEKLISEDKQIFIVTHNANIGTLLENSTSITVDLRESDFENKFKINAIYDKLNTAETRYLEGGMSALEKRVQINKSKLKEFSNE